MKYTNLRKNTLTLWQLEVSHTEFDPHFMLCSEERQYIYCDTYSAKYMDQLGSCSCEKAVTMWHAEVTVLKADGSLEPYKMLATAASYASIITKTLIFSVKGKDTLGTPRAEQTYLEPKLLQGNKATIAMTEILNPDNTDLRPCGGRNIQQWAELWGTHWILPISNKQRQ